MYEYHIKIKSSCLPNVFADGNDSELDIITVKVRSHFCLSQIVRENVSIPLLYTSAPCLLLLAGVLLAPEAAVLTRAAGPDAPVHQVIVVWEAEQGEHQLPDQVQHVVHHPEQPEGDDNLGDELGPGEPFGLATHLQLELEAVVGAGPPRVPVMGDHLLHLKQV